MTRKQKLFINFYVSNGFNATKAAKDAGYAKKTASVIGHENLRKPYIKEAIDKKVQEYISETDFAIMSTLKNLDDIRNSDIGDFANIVLIEVEPEWENDEGKIYPAKYRQEIIFKETAELNTKLISEISSGPNGIKIKMKDSLKAEELKGRYLKMWNDGVSVMQKESKKEAMSKEEQRNRILELSKKLGYK